MKKVLILAFVTVLMTGTSHSKTWNGCEDSVDYEDVTYSFRSDHTDHYTCSVLFAHPKNAITLLECDNDQLVQLEIVDDEKIYFDGLTMFSAASGKDACGVE